MTIVKLGYPGGAEYHFNGLFLLLITIVACGLFVSLIVEKAHAEKPSLIMIFSDCPICPSLEELIPWDNSNQSISGKFVNDTGSYSREAPYYENHILYYDLEDTDLILFVEPKFENHDITRNQKITIVDDFSIIPPGQKIVNGTTYHYENRITFDRCSRATIAVIDWQNILNDTITYMKNHCDEEFTNIQTVFYDQVYDEVKANPYPWIPAIVHNNTIDIGEYCKDKYPCVWEWNAPEWVKKVGVWYEEKAITHLEYDYLLAWCWDREIINQIPPH